MSAAPLSIRGLDRFFGDFHALKSVDLDVPSGSIFGFLGPNGAGKTTLIRCMMGLLRPTQGQITINGHDLRTNRRQALASVGAIVETPALYPNLTGRENLDIARHLTGSSPRDVAHVLDQVELSRDAHRKVGHYSLGMRQRLGLARALLPRPKLLVLDEPANGLDPAGIRDMRHLIRRLPEEANTTVFMSSHLLSEVEQTATHLALLRSGEVLFQGSLEALLATRPRRIRLEVDQVDTTLASITACGWSLVARESTADTQAPDTNKPDTQAVLNIEAGSEAASTAQLNRHLVEAGVNVHGLCRENAGLEDLFLDLTHSQDPRQSNQAQQPEEVAS